MECFPNYDTAVNQDPAEWAKARAAEGYSGVMVSDHFWVGERRRQAAGRCNSSAVAREKARRWDLQALSGFADSGEVAACRHARLMSASGAPLWQHNSSVLAACCHA